MNWFVSLFYIYILQSCCFPTKKEAIIKENDYVEEENNNTKLNSDNDGSKLI